MMRLSLMRDFLAFEGSKALISSILEKWGGNANTVQLIRASNNFSYAFQDQHERFILRITPEGNWSSLEEECSFLHFLLNQSICVNRPILSKNGNTVEEFHTKFGVLHAVVFNFIPGDSFEIEDISTNHFFLWGESLGAIHQASRNYLPCGKVKTIQYDLLQEVEELIPNNDVEAINELEHLKVWLDSLEMNSDNYGRIHFDFELDNLIWNDDKVSVIDFESGLEGWYVADIAFALRDLFTEQIDLSNPQFKMFMSGYRSKVNISDEELRRIPMFLRLHDLVLYATLLRSMDIEKHAHNPDWVNGLYDKLTYKVEGYKEKWKKLHR
ncbi:phosphotransferase [Ornithinibacillus sp. L9]|uniref:Phosphotransferase n=1 Tax=Ornithinibacillus caprae TaxID=2678566 RepID=A0A6N8FMI0_9BACI|nr:phosphotransferase [Ornithinibacillus caprae]MUK90543.1 phosphotransferase [Ornithinibacillus caprae]